MNPLTQTEPMSLQATPDERTWGMLAHLLSFVAAYVALGLVAPLVVLLTKGQSPGFVREHATESLNFQISTFLWIVIGGVLVLFTFGLGAFFIIPAALIYALFYVVVVIRASLAANQGQPYRYPLTLRLIKP